MNRLPIYWYIKHQQTVYSIAFNSYSIALKICIDTIQVLGYKFGMFGIPIQYDGPAHVLYDNESVENNFS